MASSGQAQGGGRGESDGKEPGFDEVLERLRGVVERLEGGKLSLEESLAAYEEGVTLARRGHTLLDRAEKRVELLVRAGSSGVEVAPFAPGARAEGDSGEGDGGGGNGGNGGGDDAEPGNRDRTR